MDVSDGRALSFVSDGLTLEGVLHLPSLPAHPEPPDAERRASRRAGIVVCHPHPQYGGDMRNNVVAALCEAAVGVGMAALRFNFRGVGGSEGAYDRGVGEQQDAVAAIAYLRSLPEVDGSRVALGGYSFGAVVTLRAAEGDLRALVAISAPTVMAPLALPKSDCPLLLVSGDRDEYSEPAALSALAGSVGSRAEVVILPGVDHFWWGSADRLTEAVSAFLAKNLT